MQFLCFLANQMLPLAVDLLVNVISKQRALWKTRTRKNSLNIKEERFNLYGTSTDSRSKWWRQDHRSGSWLSPDEAWFKLYSRKREQVSSLPYIIHLSIPLPGNYSIQSLGRRFSINHGFDPQWQFPPTSLFLWRDLRPRIITRLNLPLLGSQFIVRPIHLALLRLVFPDSSTLNQLFHQVLVELAQMELSLFPSINALAADLVESWFNVFVCFVVAPIFGLLLNESLRLTLMWSSGGTRPAHARKHHYSDVLLRTWFISSLHPGHLIWL